MKRSSVLALPLIAAASAFVSPAKATDRDIPISHHDRVYSAERFSNTVSVTDPADNTLLGAIHLGDPLPANFSPLYKGTKSVCNLTLLVISGAATLFNDASECYFITDWTQRCE